jgi:hypothetical protein
MTVAQADLTPYINYAILLVLYQYFWAINSQNINIQEFSSLIV